MPDALAGTVVVVTEDAWGLSVVPPLDDVPGATFPCTKVPCPEVATGTAVLRAGASTVTAGVSAADALDVRSFSAEGRSPLKEGRRPELADEVGTATPFAGSL